jgi:large subunit ribosomal protein L6
MSRIGKKSIEIPSGVTVQVSGSEVIVKGSKDELKMTFNPEIIVEVKDNLVNVKPKDDIKRLYPFWGLTRAMISNMIVGVSKGYEKKLEMVGVGYRAKQNGSEGVIITAGFSHPVDFKAPKGIEIQVPDQNTIIIKGADKHLVGQTASNIRKIRPPEPYKGKGIKYSGEVVRRKAGKAGKALGSAGGK